MIRARGRGVLTVCLATVLLSACGSSPSTGGHTVTLDFFQFKPEAVGTFDRLIAGFEAEHPGIRVVGFLRSVPKELEEAARTDGAGTWTIFWRVIFPLLAPMNATVGILTCLWAWNDFLLPLVVLSDPSAQTLPLAQFVFQGQFDTDYTVAFASYLMALAPVLIVYVFAQRWVISGVMRGSLK
ncbi:ABC transporter permease subunit [Streptomyces sp. NPDC127063]|uniref:carbohydrate ABC transporter permease n=1 Tax=Streptomyces sp. NPDC127063 TaxID=3347123 RepID=UPI003646E11C